MLVPYYLYHVYDTVDSGEISKVNIADLLAIVASPFFAPPPPPAFPAVSKEGT